MNKIKVYYHQKKEHRERQKDTFKYAPKEIEKISPLTEKNLSKDYIFIKKKNFIKKIITKIVVNYLPLINFSKLPPLHKKSDFVYCWSTLPLNSKKPFIIELDNPYTLTYYNYFAFQLLKPILRIILKSKKCHKIVCISEACKENLLFELGNKFKNKIIVQYPYIKDRKTKISSERKVKFLFVGKDLKRKGGYELIKAFRKIQNQNLQLEFVGINKLPLEIKKDKRIINHGIIKREVILKKIYPSVDILVFPTFHESFGMVALEALSFNLGIITTNTYALPEIVEDNGILIKNPFCKNKKWINLYFANPLKYSINQFNSKYLNNPPNMKIVAELVKSIKIAIKEKNKWKINSKSLYNQKFSEEIWQENYLKIFKK